MPDAPGSLLAIDDDAANLDMLARRLRRRGFEVVTGANGERALVLVDEGNFDLVLLDGFEVLKIIRRRHAAIDLPVIMATAKGESEDIVHALGLGADDSVTKPHAILAYGVLDVGFQVFRYVCAGHPAPADVPAAGATVIRGGTGYPIGLAECPYDEQAVALRPGDRLSLYSDGIPEALGPEDAAFGLQVLLTTASGTRGLTLEASVAARPAGVEHRCGAAGVADDVSIVAVEVLGPVAASPVTS